MYKNAYSSIIFNGKQHNNNKINSTVHQEKVLDNTLWNIHIGEYYIAIKIDGL